MPSIKSFQIERAAHDFLLTLIFEKFFDRFPRIRVASVENATGTIPDGATVTIDGNAGTVTIDALP